MKVLVTGSSGRIGQYVVKDLIEAGHEVLGTDLIAPEEKLAPFLRVDLTDAGEVYQAVVMSEAEAVVHMGAWADAGKVPDSRTYGENVQGTFNLLHACASLGVRRVISASSGQVYGFQKLPPVYAPVDENHPLRPVNSYALSKAAGEQMADYFVANHSLTILSFRLNGIRTPQELPDQMERINADPSYAVGQLWTRTDVRDAARACRLAIEKADVPSGPYNITGRLALDEPAEAIIRRVFGDQTEIREDLSAYLSPISCARAEAAFGYQPQYLWSMQQQHPE